MTGLPLIEPPRGCLRSVLSSQVRSRPWRSIIARVTDRPRTRRSIVQSQPVLTKTPPRPLSETYRRIYQVVSRIPRGRVATYGQVASLARLPRQARLVGYALHALPAASGLPWHRVVNARGMISLRSGGLGHDERQARLLVREGVRFLDGVIPLHRFGWRPRVR